MKKAWIVARKDMSEFRANKQIILSLAIFPIIMIALPVFSVIPLTAIITAPPTEEPNLNLQTNRWFDDIETSDTNYYNAWINNSVIAAGVVNRSYVNNSTLREVIASESLLDNVTVLNSVLVGCVLRNSEYDEGSTILIDTVASGTTKSEVDTAKMVFDLLLHSILLFIFFAMAVAMPTTIASYSFVGEKSSKSLEPLLATPLSDSELMWGKYLAVFVPVMAIILAVYAGTVAIINVFTYPMLGYLLMLDLTWMLSIFMITPLICIVCIAANVLLSAKVNDVRVAQQWSAFIIIPLMIVFFMGPMLSGQGLTFEYVGIVSLGLLAAMALLVGLSLKVFNREDIITTWK